MLNWNNIIKLANQGNLSPKRRLERSSEKWASILTPEQHRITRMSGTEARFSGEHCSSYDRGTYGCICCDNVLFKSDEKFNSQSGWPSFTQPAEDDAIKYIKDDGHGMVRIEAQCNVCDAHLGHVFPDGPMPSGLRYCMNSVSLNKINN